LLIAPLVLTIAIPIVFMIGGVRLVQAGPLPLNGAQAAPYTVLYQTVSGSAQSPRASGDYVVWQDRRHGQWAIYAYDLRRGEELRITREACDDTAPSISGRIVVWQRVCRGSEQGSYQYGIYAYDLASEAEFVVYEAERATVFPKVEGNYVVWLTEYGCPDPVCRGAVGIPMAQNLETIETWQLSDERQATSIDLSGGLARWRAPETVYDLEEKRTLLVLPSSWFVEAAADDQLVYRERQGDNALFVVDARSGQSALLASVQTQAGETNYQFVYAPERALLVWVRGTSTYHSNLFAYDLGLETERQLTAIDEQAASRPSLAGDILAWEAHPTTPSMDRDIYIARITGRWSAEPNTAALQARTAGPFRTSNKACARLLNHSCAPKESPGRR
jgi:beta propeller repeat protein